MQKLFGFRRTEPKWRLVRERFVHASRGEGRNRKGERREERAYARMTEPAQAALPQYTMFASRFTNRLPLSVLRGT